MTIGRVGLIGAGLMGHGIGENILAKGYELVVMAHRNRAPVDGLIARAATERASARGIAADADMVTVAAKLRAVVMAGGAASTMFGRLINVPLHDDDRQAQFAIRNARKDLRYYTNMTEELPVASFLAETTHQITVLADNLGYGERFVPRLVDVMMKVNGVVT